MIPLASSNLRAAGYDPLTARLTIEFRNDTTYAYSRVPVKVFLGLLRTDSHGRYFHAHIKDRYSYRKISG